MSVSCGKGSNALSVRSLVVDEERMRPCHWLGSVLCECLDADGQVTARTSTHRQLVPLVLKGSLPKQVKEENLGGTG